MLCIFTTVKKKFPRGHRIPPPLPACYVTVRGADVTGIGVGSPAAGCSLLLALPSSSALCQGCLLALLAFQK